LAIALRIASEGRIVLRTRPRCAALVPSGSAPSLKLTRSHTLLRYHQSRALSCRHPRFGPSHSEDWFLASVTPSRRPCANFRVSTEPGQLHARKMETQAPRSTSRRRSSPGRWSTDGSSRASRRRR